MRKEINYQEIPSKIHERWIECSEQIEEDIKILKIYSEVQENNIKYKIYFEYSNILGSFTAIYNEDKSILGHYIDTIAKSDVEELYKLIR